MTRAISIADAAGVFACSSAHRVFSWLPFGGPTPQPNINNDTVQAGPTPLLMIGGLLVAVVLLALSMRRHLRRVPDDLNTATRGNGAGEAESSADPAH